MNSILSTGAGKDGVTTGSDARTIRLRDAGKPEHLNCSRSQVYDLRANDRDFQRIVGIFYLGNVPHCFVRDLTAYKLFNSSAPWPVRGQDRPSAQTRPRPTCGR